MSKIIHNLIATYNNASSAPVASGDRIKVNQVVGRAAFVYEKIRNAVDYNEEHLIRKNAIYRIMKRKLLFEKVILENYLLETHHIDNIALQLMQELMRGKYITTEVTQGLVNRVDQIIWKYNLLTNKIKDIDGKLDKKVRKFLFEIAAVEIENTIKPDVKGKALIRAMFSVMNPRLKMPSTMDDEKEKELQLYVACHKILYKWDDSMINYLLLTLYYPGWKDADDALILKLANNSKKIIAEFEKQKVHLWAKRMMSILQPKAVVFWVIQDILEEHKEKVERVFEDAELLEAEIKKACQKRYKGIAEKLRRGVVRSIVYVFFTKMLLAIALEFPMDIFISGTIDYFAALINIGFPPVLMTIVAILIRLPKKDNTEKILQEIKMITYKDGDPKMYPLKDPKSRSKFFKYAFNLIFTATFIFSLMVIFWGLNKLGFNFFSSLIFVLFLTLVSFFGIRIRRPVNDIMAVERRDSLLGVVIDFVTLPFVNIGRWLSTKFSKFNFLAFFLDFIIEAPFKLLVEIFEDLFSFYKEKKEDMMQE